MRIGYFDCFAGASGDMILASLLDAGFDRSGLVEGLSQVGVGDLDIDIKEVSRKGIWAKSFSFTSRKPQEDRSFEHISRLIQQSVLSGVVKERSLAAFDLLAEAESKIHRIDKHSVHFHEVGSVDSLVDVVGSFLGLEKLEIGEVVSSPLALGRGYVDCEHGRIPVPAPATLEIAAGIPVRGWQVEGELTTPTGAAILRASGASFGPVPAMTLTGVGYGAGSREMDSIPNVLRLMVGERKDYDLDQAVLVETNIDDMNPQFFSHLYDQMLTLGALDVWVSSILMKKGRPGFLFSVLCGKDRLTQIIDAVLSGTTTAGVRLRELDRVKLKRQVVQVQTKYGRVRVKVFQLDSHHRCVPEYQDCLEAARAKGVAVSDVMEDAKNAYLQTGQDRS